MFMIRDWGEKRTTLGLSYMPTLFPGFLSLSPSKKYFCEEGRERSLGARLGLCLCFSFTLSRWAVRKKTGHLRSRDQVSCAGVLHLLVKGS